MNFRLFIASGFFLGLMPIFPGSFGALIGLAWGLLPCLLIWEPMLTCLWCISGIILFAFAHFWLTPWAQEYWRSSDPKNFVLDEIIGYLCVPVYLLGNVPGVCYYILAFVIFRILDAIKLPGARYIDRNIHSAAGVLLDDVVSAAYTAAFLFVFIKCREVL